MISYSGRNHLKTLILIIFLPFQINIEFFASTKIKWVINRSGLTNREIVKIIVSTAEMIEKMLL